MEHARSECDLILILLRVCFAMRGAGEGGGSVWHRGRVGGGGWGGDAARRGKGEGERFEEYKKIEGGKRREGNR